MYEAGGGGYGCGLLRVRATVHCTLNNNEATSGGRLAALPNRKNRVWLVSSAAGGMGAMMGTSGNGAVERGPTNWSGTTGQGKGKLLESLRDWDKGISLQPTKMSEGTVGQLLRGGAGGMACGLEVSNQGMPSSVWCCREARALSAVIRGAS